MFLRLLLLSVSGLAGADYRQPRLVGTISIPGLTESSGLVASRSQPGVFWTHNDSGNGPWLFAFSRQGLPLGRWRVRNAINQDWEDIAAGPGPGHGTYLYIGDIGDNDRKRSSVIIYRVSEPTIRLGQDEAGVTAPADAFRLRYPDGPHDAECLLVHPRTGDLYVVTKAKLDDPVTRVYKAKSPLISGDVVPFGHIANIEFPDDSAVSLIFGRVTGGDISPDGTRVILCDYFRAWEARIPRDIDAVWTGRWTEVNTGARPQGEGICYRHDGKAVLTSSEGPSFPLIEIEQNEREDNGRERR